MVLELPQELQMIVNDIMSKIPSNPYVVDVVGKAIEIAYENRDEENFKDKLQLASQVASYVTKISEPMYYETYMVQAVLLMGIPYEKYSTLDSASGLLKTATEDLTEFLCTGSWKKRYDIIYRVIKSSPKLSAVYFMVLNQIAECVLNPTVETPETLYTKLGLGYLEVCLRKSDLNILNEVYPYKNLFMSIVLDKLDF